MDHVARYKVEDNCSGKVVANIRVKGRSIDDPAFVAKLNRPVDIVSRIIYAEPRNKSSQPSNRQKMNPFLGSFKQSDKNDVRQKVQQNFSAHSDAIGPVSDFEVSKGDMREVAHARMTGDGDDDWTGEDNGVFQDGAQESCIHWGGRLGKAVETDRGERACQVRFCLGLYSNCFCFLICLLCMRRLSNTGPSPNLPDAILRRIRRGVKEHAHV